MTEQKYTLKPYTVEERKSLPKEIRLIIMFALKGFNVQPFLLDDAFERFPECFENPNQLRIES